MERGGAQPSSKTKPNFNASDPTAYAEPMNAYPGFGGYDDLCAAPARWDSGSSSRSPAMPPLGDRRRQGHRLERQLRPSAGEFAQFAARWRSATPAISATCRRCSTSRSGTSPTTASSSSPRRSAPAIYRKMVDAAIPKIRAANKNARIFIGETAPVGRAPKAMGPKEFIRKWLCLNSRLRRTSAGSCRSFKQIDADGYAHHPYGPTARVPRTRDVINMLAIRELGKLPRPRGRRAGSRASCRSTTPSSASSRTRPTGRSAPRRCARRS